MIDLNVPQILTEPVKCWVRDSDKGQWAARWLKGITKESMDRYVTVGQYNHTTTMTIDLVFLNITQWMFCTLTDPYALKEVPWQTIEDVPNEAWGGWIIKLDNIGWINILTPSGITIDYEGTLMDTYDYKWKPKGSHPLKGEWLSCVNYIKEN